MNDARTELLDVLWTHAATGNEWAINWWTRLAYGQATPEEIRDEITAMIHALIEAFQPVKTAFMEFGRAVVVSFQPLIEWYQDNAAAVEAALNQQHPLTVTGRTVR